MDFYLSSLCCFSGVKMKLGEIKIESLRLMSVNTENLNINNIKNYEYDDLYREYLDRMPGAINRAISRMIGLKALPCKIAEVNPSQCEIFSQFLKLNLKTIISNLNSIERIIYINKDTINTNVEYQTLGDGEVLIHFNELHNYKGNDEKFVIEYMPILDIITTTTDNNFEIDVPETLARMIPYFVKGELYEQDEPEIAATSRNIFESALSEYISYGKPKKARQQYVKNVMF